MWSTVILVLISLVNSTSLTLAIWAGLQLHDTDWWIVFLIVFIMGAIYNVEYFRRKIPSITSQSRNRLDVELDDLSRPAAAHVPTGRGTREPVTALRVVTASL